MIPKNYIIDVTLKYKIRHYLPVKTKNYYFSYRNKIRNKIALYSMCTYILLYSNVKVLIIVMSKITYIT